MQTLCHPYQITDIAAACTIAKQAGAMVAVDSTCATPVLTQPIALGADIVMHAATKYLNGHSDVVAGTLTSARAISKKSRDGLPTTTGSTPLA